MFEKFTDSARRVIDLAQEDARALRHNYIGTEHLLLGLIHQDEGIAAHVLESLGVSSAVVRQQVEEIVGRGRRETDVDIPFTPRAMRVLELSGREARHLGSNSIGPEHILLGLIREGEGIGAQVLTRFGVDLHDARHQVVQLLENHPVEKLSVSHTGPISSPVGGSRVPPARRVLDQVRSWVGALGKWARPPTGPE